MAGNEKNDMLANFLNNQTGKASSDIWRIVILRSCCTNIRQIYRNSLLSRSLWIPNY